MSFESSEEEDADPELDGLKAELAASELENIFKGMKPIDEMSRMGPSIPSPFSSSSSPVPISSKTLKFDTSKFVGLYIGDAQELADDHRIAHRIASSDGTPMMLTSDHDLSRVNFHIMENKVTAVELG